MIVSRAFISQLPFAFCALMLATVLLVRASAPVGTEMVSIASLFVSEAMAELASE